MPDMPWSGHAEMESGVEYLVMASYLPLKRLASTPRLFRGVSAIRRQLASAEGLVGYTLRAKPLAGNYWTLSVWKDQAALQRFVSAPPHAEIMSSLRPIMGATKFVTWMTTGAEGRPEWPAAIERLAST